MMSFLSKLFGRRDANDKPAEPPVEKNAENRKEYTADTKEIPVGNTDSQHLLELVTVADGIALPRVMANDWQAIEKTARNTIIIKAVPDEDLDIRQSKFGHYPCIPKGFDYPRDRAGNCMYPLAQFNLSELPQNDALPATGFLQFYIALDDVYGLSFEQHVPSDFKVLFFEEAELEDYEHDFSFLGNILNEEERYPPVSCPHSLRFEPKIEYIGMLDVACEEAETYNIHQLLSQNNDVKDELNDMLYESFSANGHKIGGGYAYFTQSDPRAGNDDIRDFMLLFQMDSDDEIIWGDVGVANFFIHPEKLAAKDFSDVFYSWDCS